MNNDQLLIVAQMRSPNAVSLSIEEGTHFPLSLTTSGRVFLSMFDAKKRNEQILEALKVAQTEINKLIEG